MSKCRPNGLSRGTTIDSKHSTFKIPTLLAILGRRPSLSLSRRERANRLRLPIAITVKIVTLPTKMIRNGTKSPSKASIKYHWWRKKYKYLSNTSQTGVPPTTRTVAIAKKWQFAPNKTTTIIHQAMTTRRREHNLRHWNGKRTAMNRSMVNSTIVQADNYTPQTDRQTGVSVLLNIQQPGMQLSFNELFQICISTKYQCLDI